jgi:hypothetical protein
MQNRGGGGGWQMVVEFTPGHAAPAGQQVILEPLPHGLLPAAHPQRPRLRSRQATPALQQFGPHAVVPAGQQQDLPEPIWEQVVPDGQQKFPQRGPPPGQNPEAAVAAPNGFRTAAPTAAAAAVPKALRAWRRVDVVARVWVSRSKDPTLVAGTAGRTPTDRSSRGGSSRGTPAP